jgi:hypothetical protein
MTEERPRSAASGYIALVVGLVALAGGLWVLVVGIGSGGGYLVITVAALLAVAVLALGGLVVVQPNEARVLVLFGTYHGTVKHNGFFWVNPFYTKRRITLRSRNLNGQKLKVNDKGGNPIEIAAVVVWQVEDTYRAAFEVQDYDQYVVVQSEAAVRHMAGEDTDEELLTLRAGADQVNAVLVDELTQRLAPAGIKVIEARLSHLAYAPEIAEAMLRRQQASAVVAARFQIVNGAVSMVELALAKLSERHVVELDEERKAAMVTNLLVVLCSETAASPVVNAGTLYT